MKFALLALGAFTLAGCATDPKEGDPLAHHPAGAASPMPAAPTPGQMDTMMKSMQEMHDRMRAAKTPEERARLMQEHMKLMHEGMGMLGRMRAAPEGSMGGMGMGHVGMAMSPEPMHKRMEMMEMMMRTMMDCEAMRPPAAPR